MDHPPYRILLFALISGVLWAACNLFVPVGGLPPLLVTAPPDSTATPTPFLPLFGQPTPTLLLPVSPTPSVTAPPSPPTATPAPWDGFPPPRGDTAFIPTPLPPFPRPKGQVHIAILGSDQRPNDYGFRTDTLLIAILDPSRHQVRLLSIPRDLWVYIPGWYMNRINTAYPYGGFETLQLTLQYNLGLPVDHFVLINFQAFVALVDNLGGIDVQVERSLTDHRDGYGQYTVPAGWVHMDGATALWYVRARYTTSDFDRARRQQEVLLALADRLLSLNALSRVGELYSLYRNYVVTDLSLQDVNALATFADAIARRNLQRYVIQPPYVSPWVVPTSGAEVLLPTPGLLPFLQSAIQP